MNQLTFYSRKYLKSILKLHLLILMFFNPLMFYEYYLILANATHEFLKKNITDPQTSDLIIKLEEKTFSRFDGLDKALLNLKVT